MCWVATGGKVEGLELPKRVFPCASPADVRSTLPRGKDVLAFQCRNPIHKAHYELFIRALEAPNVGEGAVCLVHPTCGPTQVPPAPLFGIFTPGDQHPKAYSVTFCAANFVSFNSPGHRSKGVIHQQCGM